MIRNYLKIALRSILKNRTYSFINITGLALGMATAVLLVLWVQNELSYDGYHRKANNIYRINTHLKINDTESWHWGNTPLKFGEYLKDNTPEIQRFTRLNIPYGDFSLGIKNDIIAEEKLAFVDKNWFQVFDYQLVRGNVKDFERDKNNIAITESRAKKFFGDADPIGKIIKHDSLNFMVQVVLKDLPSNSSFPFEVIAQNEARLVDPKILENDAQWNNFNYQTFIVGSDGMNIKAVSAKFTKLLIKLRAEEDSKTTLELSPLKALHFDSIITTEGMPPAGDRKVLYIFSIIAVFILLIACINYVNLTTAKASQRSKEVSVKKIIGASTGSLFNQFFIESIITSLCAALLAIVLIIYGLPVLGNIVNNHFSLSENPVIWAILGGITLLSVLLTGIYPSILLSSFQPLKLLKGASIGGTKNATFRKSLVVFQFTFTIVLLIGTLLIFRQLRFIQEKNLGYNKEHIFTFTIPWSIKNKEAVKQTMLEKLKAESSIQDVTVSNANIIDLRNTHSGSLNWKGKDPKWEPTVSPFAVLPNLQTFFKLKLSSGRWFEEGNKADENNVVLNETAIKEFKILLPAVGQQFEFNGRKGQIIGIAKDFHFRSPKEKIKPMLMFTGNNWLSSVFVKTAPNQFQKSIAIAEKTWKELVPNVAFKYEFLDESYQNLHRSEEKQLVMFNVFAGIVLLISCFGLFGLATFSAEVRIKEIGIRKVLGASVASIINLLSKDFLILVLISIVLASPIAYWAMDKWLQDFAYHVNIDWWIFALSALLITVIALLTVSYQAIRAALMNPVKSLKTE